MQTGRDLSRDVTRLGEMRLGDLEQALALCQEVDQSFGELHTWLETIENEFENNSSLTTGIQRDELLKQQAINMVHSLVPHFQSGKSFVFTNTFPVVFSFLIV